MSHTDSLIILLGFWPAPFDFLKSFFLKLLKSFSTFHTHSSNPSSHGTSSHEEQDLNSSVCPKKAFLTHPSFPLSIFTPSHAPYLFSAQLPFSPYPTAQAFKPGNFETLWEHNSQFSQQNLYTTLQDPRLKRNFLF